MRVDVIIPCRNAARYIADALESVMRQTHRDLAVVVVDDGSNDDTVRIARGFGARVTVLEQANKGPSAARNTALRVSRGECVAFLDADDRWHPEKLARQVSHLRTRPECGLVHTAIRQIDAAGEPGGAAPNMPRRRATQGDCLAVLLERNAITTSSVLLRRDVLGGDEFLAGLHHAEDWDLWLRLAARTRFGYIDEALTDYRVHDTNATRLEEQMLAGMLTALDRAIARTADPALRRPAYGRRREIVAALAHTAYERDDIDRARLFFRQARPALDSLGWARYVAVSLPAAVRRPARRCWRRLRGALTA